MFDLITLHDFSKPLSQRIRKHTGPYKWRPAAPGKGRGFYTQYDKSTSDPSCAQHGAGFNLRIEPAQDHVSGRMSYTTGFGGSDLSETYKPIVFRLPRSRGFLAGWTLGAGMASTLEPEIYDCIQDAAMAAYSCAQSAAEDEIDYQDARNEGMRLREQMKNARVKLSAAVADARAASEACLAGANLAAERLYEQAQTLSQRARRMRDEALEELANAPGGSRGDALRNGYNEAW